MEDIDLLEVLFGQLLQRKEANSKYVSRFVFLSDITPHGSSKPEIINVVLFDAYNYV